MKRLKRLITFFANVGKEVYKEIRHNRNTHDQNSPVHCSDDRPKFRPKPVTVDVVIKTVLNLKNKNSCGADGISSRFLKDSIPVLAFYLTVIINTSIVTGLTPENW